MNAPGTPGGTPGTPGTDTGMPGTPGTDNGGAGNGSQPPPGGDGDTPPPAGDGDSTPPPSTGSSGTWAMMGYDERNWYYNPNETTLSVDNAGTLVEKWRFTTTGNPNGTPVVAEGKVFVQTTGMGVVALGLEDGQMIWNTSNVPGTASVAYADGAIYAHDSMAQLWKLSADDGSVMWGPVKADAQSGCDGTSSPILGGDKVIVGHSCGLREVGQGGGASGARGGVEAHNITDGSKAWTYFTVPESGENGAMVWSSVGIDVSNGVVFAASGNNYTMQGENSDAIHAIDINTGMRIWKNQVRNNDTWSIPGAIGGPDTDFGANPIVSDTAVAAGDKGAAFWNMDITTGNTNWGREGLSAARDAAHGGFLMNGAFDGTNYYGVTNDTGASASHLYAMNASTGDDAFPRKTFPGKYAWGAPSVANGVLVVPINDDLYILNAADGSELTKFSTGGTIAAGAAAIVDGKVIVGSGLLYPFGPDAINNNEVICYGLP